MIIDVSINTRSSFCQPTLFHKELSNVVSQQSWFHLCSPRFSAVYHYQMKMHVFSYQTLGEADATFFVTLHGTNGESDPLSLEM